MNKDETFCPGLAAYLATGDAVIAEAARRLDTDVAAAFDRVMVASAAVDAARVAYMARDAKLTAVCIADSAADSAADRIAAAVARLSALNARKSALTAYETALESHAKAKADAELLKNKWRSGLGPVVDGADVPLRPGEMCEVRRVA